MLANHLKVREKHNCAFSELIQSVCQMTDNLFTGECHSKSELGPCLAGPPGLFIELYDNSAARPGPAWAHSPSDRQLF